MITLEVLEKQEVNNMINKAVDQVLKNNLGRKISDKTDLNHYHDNENPESG